MPDVLHVCEPCAIRLDDTNAEYEDRGPFGYGMFFIKCDICGETKQHYFYKYRKAKQQLA